MDSRPIASKRSAQEAGIYDGNELIQPKKRHKEDQAIEITLQTPNCSSMHRMQVFPSDSMEDVFFKAFKLASKGWHTGNQDYWFNLYCQRFGDLALCSWKTVKEVLINGDKLMMRYDSDRIKRNPATMQIFVKTMEGRFITIDTLAEGQDAVQSLKWMLGCELGIPRRLQRLSCAGREMKDGRVLSDFNVARHCTVHLTSQMIGS